jgi:glycosyltransferase involved in cell wall biosynthesis
MHYLVDYFLNYFKRDYIMLYIINKGVYYSRIESILFAKGNYIILMDPDDLYLNENLFKELYTSFLLIIPI